MKTLILFLLFLSNAFAHPVIYKDGWAFNSSNMESFSNNYVMYSFTNRFAVGADLWRLDEKEFALLKLNHLLYRYNGEDSQANIYLHGGLGVEGNSLVGAEADWETRTLYTSIKHYQFQKNYMSTARVGISPKETPFESLQTWFMLQGMVIGDIEDTVMITPMLRFFYNNVLWEMGSSTKGDWMFNLMVHY